MVRRRERGRERDRERGVGVRSGADTGGVLRVLKPPSPSSQDNIQVLMDTCLDSWL